MRKGIRFFLTSLSLLISTTVFAGEHATNDVYHASISIIIDDMGYNLKSGQRAINLPGQLTYSFLPHSPYANPLSKLAHHNSKEVMLHLPMEAESGNKLGPGGLTRSMTDKKFLKVLERNINAIPHARGFNNHMGSLLTKSQVWMKKLMQEVAADKNLFFVDSKTTSQSVALNAARAEGLKSISRDIFIDHEMSETFMLLQLRKLEARARVKGTALAIAHPKNLTLSVLEKWLPELKMKGIKLVSVSELINLQQQIKLALWRAPGKNDAATDFHGVKN